MSEETTGGFLQPIGNRQGTSLATTIEHNGYLILTGKEMAVFKVSELFTKREVDEMQREIKTVDDFMEYMNEFYRRSKIENFVPFDSITNGEFEPILKKKQWN